MSAGYVTVGCNVFALPDIQFTVNEEMAFVTSVVKNIWLIINDLALLKTALKRNNTNCCAIQIIVTLG